MAGEGGSKDDPGQPAVADPERTAQYGRGMGWVAFACAVGMLFFPLNPIGFIIGDWGNSAGSGLGGVLFVIALFTSSIALSVRWRSGHVVDWPPAVAVGLIAALVAWQITVATIALGRHALFLWVLFVPLFGGLGLAVAGWLRYRRLRPTAPVH